MPKKQKIRQSRIDLKRRKPNERLTRLLKKLREKDRDLRQKMPKKLSKQI